MVCIIVNWGFSVGSCLDLFLSPSLYYVRLPSDHHGGYMMGGSKSRGDCLLRLSSFVLYISLSYI